MRDAAQVHDLQRFHTDFHLLDAYSPRTPGRHGRDASTGSSRGSTRARRRWCSPAGSTPDNVGRAIESARPFARRRRQRHRGGAGPQGPRQAGRRSSARWRRPTRGCGSAGVSAPPVERRFGPYGGRYVPETLIPALDELERDWLEARADPAFTERARAACCATTSAGRRRSTAPPRLSELTGGEVWLKREDLHPHRLAQDQQRARAGAARPADGQAARDRGDRRRASTAWRAATACALLGLECIVYMGTEDMRRQQPERPADAPARAPRWSASRPARARSRRRCRRRSATGSANVETTHYVIGSAVGPAPYPALVRDLQRTIGDEARAQVLEAAGPAARPRDRLRRRRLERDRHLRRPSSDDAGVELIGVEAAGEGLETRRHSAPLTTGARGVLHGALSAVLQDEEGQILEAHSVSAGPRLPGRRAPSTPTCATAAACRYVAVPDARRAGGVPTRGGARGHPAGARAGARARLAARQPRRGRRARPGHALGPRRQGPRRGARAREDAA